MTQKTCFDLPEELYKNLKIEAVNRGSTLKDLVIKYIEYGLENNIK